MPWVCQVCAASNDAPQADPQGPFCYMTAQCKAKKGYAAKWVAPIGPPPVLTTEEIATQLGYPDRVNTSQAKFPNGHKTGVVFANAAGTRAISPDGSTHSGDRDGWKGFFFVSGGYSYRGSFDLQLAAWAHRPNTIHVGAFPQGAA